MKLMKCFTKKGYFYGGKYLVFKSYGTKTLGVLQSPALEDEEGYIVHTIYTTELNVSKQATQTINSYIRQAGWVGSWMFRVFDENGEPYEDL